jgi:hypothetical protein
MPGLTQQLVAAAYLPGYRTSESSRTGEEISMLRRPAKAFLKHVKIK